MISALMENHPHRKRLLTAFFLALTIAVGLASRKIPWALETFGKYPGDALWALAVFFGWMFLFPRKSVWNIAAVAFALSCLVEVSQLYQAPWLNDIRKTTLGHLVLGSTFSWWDIVAYGVGILLGVTFDCAIRRTRQHPTPIDP